MAYFETIQKEILSVPPIEILTRFLVEQMARINGEMNLAEAHSIDPHLIPDKVEVWEYDTALHTARQVAIPGR